MITDLLNTLSNVTLTNLNKCTNVAELKGRFNEHPISNAYKLDYLDSYGDVTTATSSVFQLSARFNNLTSYYNLQTSVNVGTNTQIIPYISNYQFSGGVSYSSSTTGTTSTPAKEVCRRDCESKGEMRTKRCVPCSTDNVPYA